MEETKEIKEEKKKKAKHKKDDKCSIGDVVFGTVLIVIMFLTVLIAYAYYITG